MCSVIEHSVHYTYYQNIICKEYFRWVSQHIGRYLEGFKNWWILAGPERELFGRSSQPHVPWCSGKVVKGKYCTRFAVYHNTVSKTWDKQRYILLVCGRLTEVRTLYSMSQGWHEGPHPCFCVLPVLCQGGKCAFSYLYHVFAGIWHYECVIHKVWKATDSIRLQ